MSNITTEMNQEILENLDLTISECSKHFQIDKQSDKIIKDFMGKLEGNNIDGNSIHLKVIIALTQNIKKSSDTAGASKELEKLIRSIKGWM